LARLIQNGFIGEAKASEVRKTGFFRLLVHFNLDLQNGYTLQCLDLCKIDEAEAGISRAKEALNFAGERGRDGPLEPVVYVFLTADEETLNIDIYSDG